MQGGPQAICCAAGSLAALDPGGAAVGFHALPPLDQSALVELTRGPDTSASAAEATERFFATLGKHAAWVQRRARPGARPDRVPARSTSRPSRSARAWAARPTSTPGWSTALNHPRGPLTWADRIGLDHVLGVLDGLADELREERYRVAPALRRLGWAGKLGVQTGEGFYVYEEAE